TFNLGGLVWTDFSPNFGSTLGTANSMAIQADGKYVVAGYNNVNGPNNFALLRYNTNGTLDQSFGLHGLATTNIANSDSRATNVFIQGDGRIVIAGTSGPVGNTTLSLTRYSGLQAGVLQFSAATYSVPENGGSITITVNRVNGTDNTATVNYATSDGT